MLNDKQKKFIEEYIIDFDRARAYKSAYPNCKSNSTANTNAFRLLQKEEVKLEIQRLQSLIQSEKIADATEVMEYLSKVMRREEKENIVVTLFEEKVDFEKDENGVPRRTSSKKEYPQIVQIPTKVSDSNKAAELLGKRYNMFKENADITLTLPKFVGEEELQD